ncbi:MAG: PqqD family protein [Candidatus Omnitrophica bacterium]|nr:PqqD family protein [Candidatus Omnitrophota bacterium]MBU4590658.1 PqqD family protein [Candidatus Omnitrophota bacterium]
MFIKAQDGLFARETENGLVVLNKNESKIFMLNKTAASIWKICSSGSMISADKILPELEKEYVMDRKDLERCRKTCVAIIKENSELFEISY